MNHQIIGPKFVFVIAVITFLAVLFFTFTIVHVGYANCQDIQTLNTNATLSLHRALKSLDSISYYKNHPDEKAQQIIVIKQQLKEFAPQSCRHIFTPWG